MARYSIPCRCKTLRIPATPSRTLALIRLTKGAKVLGAARHTLSRVINGQAGISPAMAIRLEKTGWSNADQWPRPQVAYDLDQPQPSY